MDRKRHDRTRKKREDRRDWTSKFDYTVRLRYTVRLDLRYAAEDRHRPA